MLELLKVSFIGEQAKHFYEEKKPRRFKVRNKWK